MHDRWFSMIKLPLSLKQFHQLPQNPAYKYEYINKIAWLSPRPKFYSAVWHFARKPEPRPRRLTPMGRSVFGGSRRRTGLV